MVPINSQINDVYVCNADILMIERNPSENVEAHIIGVVDSVTTLPLFSGSYEDCVLRYRAIVELSGKKTFTGFYDMASASVLTKFPEPEPEEPEITEDSAEESTDDSAIG